MLFYRNLSLTHVVEDSLDHGDEDPPDDEPGFAPALFLCVPGMADDQTRNR